MNQTQDKPSALAKLLGFYTIEIKNIETGAIEGKADVLVMENLFYAHDIQEAYDLKGIKGRKVKGERGTTKTSFDYEWIESKHLQTRQEFGSLIIGFLYRATSFSHIHSAPIEAHFARSHNLRCGISCWE